MFSPVWNTQKHNNIFSFFPFPLQNYFARNFYNMRMLALFVAFAINFILLFYKVEYTLQTFFCSQKKNVSVSEVCQYCMHFWSLPTVAVVTAIGKCEHTFTLIYYSLPVSVCVVSKPSLHLYLLLLYRDLTKYPRWSISLVINLKESSAYNDILYIPYCIPLTWSIILSCHLCWWFDTEHKEKCWEVVTPWEVILWEETINLDHALWCWIQQLHPEMKLVWSEWIKVVITASTECNLCIGAQSL